MADSSKDLENEVAELEQAAQAGQNDRYNLNDDRRIKTLSPGALILKRFFRNRLAVVGLIMLLAMFVFSFVGGLVSPYGQDEQFFTYMNQDKQYAGISKNENLRYTVADGAEFGAIPQGKMTIAARAGETSFESKDVTYGLETVGDGVFVATLNGKQIAVASAETVNAPDGGAAPDFAFTLAALTANASGATSFEANGTTYDIDENGNITQGGQDAGYVSQYIVSPADNSVTITRDLREALISGVEANQSEITFKDADGNDQEYDISFDANKGVYDVIQSNETYVYSRYEAPSSAHWLGLDTNGMDMLTRLMYGGRVSLVIGFIVVFIAGGLGILLGGISGYFGGWVDNLIMRIVDVFYCLPMMPIVIILGSMMDAMRLDPMIRMVYLMLVLGFLSWPSIARLVRGQILSLREQEFMVATEACGISIPHRIFKHLIPNVMPQLIVSCTMMLGSTIITEATLSFLGLGVKFPFASWGNIINDVNNSYVLTNYWFIWIPAGICLLITVLGFNFVGDGLRDAFDPKMNR